MKKILILLFPILLLSNTTKSVDLNDEIYCEISNGVQTVRYSFEGLLLYNISQGYDKKKQIFLACEDIDYDKLPEFKKFMIRNDFFLYNSNYSNCDCVFLGSSFDWIILNKQRYSSPKIINYHSQCYNEKLDSLYYYMNSLIPKKLKKDYEIKTHINYKDKCPCN